MGSIFEMHAECGKIFKETLIDTETGKTLACRMYDKLVEDGNCQDCLGENFNQLLHRINDNWFTNYKPTGDRDYYFLNYTLLLYLFVERIDVIFSLINPDGKTKLFNDVRQKGFVTLTVINKWANFFKHPKQFLFTHWPTYYFEGMDYELGKGDLLINTDFIMKHYFSDKSPAPKMLENHDRVYVEIPDLINLTKNFCIEMIRFFDFICKNQVVLDLLKEKSTIKLMYRDISEEEDKAAIPVEAK